MSLTVTAAATSDIGRRSSQQDDSLIQSGIFPHKPNSHLFVILDGHGQDGAKVASFAKRTFLESVIEFEVRIAADPVKALKEIFNIVHEKIANNQAIDSYMSGSTASLALIVGTTLMVAHVGDSRIVLGRASESGSIDIKQLTTDHNCDQEAELARVSAAGARVEKLIIDNQPDGPLRIFKGTLPYPGLVVTRALGDTVATRLGILSDPEVAIIQLTAADRFLIMGTDGVWDGVTYEEILDAVATCPDPADASKRITEASLAGMDKQNLDDNTTNIVIYFRWET
ncbi:hypothetical protein PhCBS80983_g03587 [Powellomyces hirtus]|uniref:PPM-type phosphatase domain-containing protein n=1 Tax=Powellomyces hirtus TaxID=109895 RepID=A0A507E1S6_9FUNG|nr:hypothetical protein PhCBS80983_g03587 [Powellomyces hirtus]